MAPGRCRRPGPVYTDFITPGLWMEKPKSVRWSNFSEAMQLVSRAWLKRHYLIQKLVIFNYCAVFQKDQPRRTRTKVTFYQVVLVASPR